jgi:hypothetical protein
MGTEPNILGLLSIRLVDILKKLSLIWKLFYSWKSNTQNCAVLPLDYEA